MLTRYIHKIPKHNKFMKRKKRMSEEIIVRHCSPTLAGLKTGSIFAYDFSCRSEMLRELRDLNKQLVPKGLRALPLKYENERALVYIYRPDMLKRDLSDLAAHRLLCRCGYSCKNCCEDIVRLQKRLKSGGGFPHEIGLFLGYPPSDVEGFIKNDRPCRLCGYWKVYGNEEHARRCFDKFSKCTRVYSRLQRQGSTLDKLTVKVRKYE